MSQHVEQIARAIKWASKEGLSAPVEILLQARAKLAGHLFGLASEVGDAYMEKVQSEFRRKKKFNERRAHYTDMMKLPVSQAEIKAENDIAAEREIEATSDGIYRQIWLLYDAGKEVLQSMAQQISTQNRERGLEMRGMGSQASHG